MASRCSGLEERSGHVGPVPVHVQLVQDHVGVEVEVFEQGHGANHGLAQGDVGREIVPVSMIKQIITK